MLHGVNQLEVSKYHQVENITLRVKLLVVVLDYGIGLAEDVAGSTESDLTSGDDYYCVVNNTSNHGEQSIKWKCYITRIYWCF